jgi:hypothetical protein
MIIEHQTMERRVVEIFANLALDAGKSAVACRQLRAIPPAAANRAL